MKTAIIEDKQKKQKQIIHVLDRGSLNWRQGVWEFTQTVCVLGR